jgi:hypothetical protein
MSSTLSLLPSRQRPAQTYDEVAATRTTIERTRRRFKLTPKRLEADTAYGTGKFLDLVVSASIIPAWDSSAQDNNVAPKAGTAAATIKPCARIPRLQSDIGRGTAAESNTLATVSSRRLWPAAMLTM